MSLLEVNRLEKSFLSPGGENFKVVSVDSFLLNHSEFCGMMGESGSGKTTFLHLLAGILTPDKGSIKLDGQDLTKLNVVKRDYFRTSSIGYIFQSFNLLQGLTCLENLKLPMYFSSKFDEEYAEELLVRVGLEDRISYRPSQLSIGQQQRVALARALVSKPKLVLADEPTGNLDAKNATKAIDLLCELCNETKTALLAVSHDERVIENFDQKIKFQDINDQDLILNSQG